MFLKFRDSCFQGTPLWLLLNMLLSHGIRKIPPVEFSWLNFPLGIPQFFFLFNLSIGEISLQDLQACVSISLFIQ